MACVHLIRANQQLVHNHKRVQMVTKRLQVVALLMLEAQLVWFTLAQAARQPVVTTILIRVVQTIV